MSRRSRSAKHTPGTDKTTPTPPAPPAPSYFLRPYQETMEANTDAPPVYHQACAYALFGSLLTRESHRCRLAEGIPPHWTNLWVILVGDSGKERKSTAMDMSLEILRRIDPHFLGPNDMSPEGLIEHLRRQPPESGPTVLLHQREFLNLLLQFRRPYSQPLKALLLELFDVPFTYRRVLRKSTVDLLYPRATLVGGITYEFLARYGATEDWLGGFFNRCLFVYGKKKRHQRHAPRMQPETFDGLALGLGRALEAWKLAQEERRDVIKDKDGNERRGEFPSFGMGKAANVVAEQIPDGSDDPLLHGLINRAHVHFEKVAAIEQIDEDPTASEIGKGAAERAAKFIQLWINDAPRIVAQCFARGREDFDGDRLAKTIHRHLVSVGGRSEFHTILITCGMNSKKTREALDSLIDSRAVRIVAQDVFELIPTAAEVATAATAAAQ